MLCQNRFKKVIKLSYSVNMEKPQIRKLFRKITARNVHKDSFNITHGLYTQFAILMKRLEREKLLSNHMIASYICLPNKEIPPPHIQGYEYAYPRFDKKLITDEVPLMEFKLLPDINSCEEEVYGIKVPPKHLETVFPSVTLVPLTCFNPVSKQRIGKGGGYYDCYIRFMRKSGIKSTFVGVASSFLECQQQFWADHDQPLDFIITEKNIY